MNEKDKSRLRTCNENGWCAGLFRCAVLSCIVCLGAVLSPLAARAEVIQILYDSFESPDVATSSGDTPTGWTKEHSYSGMWDIAWGSSNWVSTPFGSQGIRCWQGTGFKTAAITEKLQPGATYTLTFNVGNVNPETGAPRASNGYQAYILAGTNVIASVSGTTSTDTLTSTNGVSVTTTGAHPDLGKTLGIRLKDNGADYHWQTLFDNVLLVVEESSENKQSIFYGK